MPRFPRNYLDTSFFNVMSQGINKSFIFQECKRLVKEFLKEKELELEELRNNKIELMELIKTFGTI